MDRIEQNEKLRKKIVNLADVWDGKESIKYGKRLYDILHDLDIFDTPDFYTSESFLEAVDKVLLKGGN